MARRRSNQTTATTTEKESNTVSTVEYFQEIPADLLLELKAKSRPRGVYEKELHNFIEQGAPGVKVSLDAGPFAGKKSQSVKSSFNNVITKDKTKSEDEQQFQSVVVREDDGNVYLLRTDM
jgi:hypothetical protein